MLSTEKTADGRQGVANHRSAVISDVSARYWAMIAQAP
jgi:hypothetical protein